MSTSSISVRHARFTVGWVLLLGIAVLMTLNHAVLIFVLNEPVLFIGWAAFSLYATLVLWIPFRRGERWAWFFSWISVIALGSEIAFDSQVGPLYLGAAAVMAVGFLLTYPTGAHQESAS
jgi:hypothetical protein